MNRFIGFLLCCFFLGMTWSCNDEEEIKNSSTGITVSLGSLEFKTLESITPFRIPVVLSEVAVRPVTVTGFIKSEDRAKEGVDYLFAAKQIVIPAGKSTGYFDVEIKDYPEYTPDRTFEFEIVGVEGAELSGLDICRVIIMSNEGLPELGFTNTFVSVTEEIGQITVAVNTDRVWDQAICFKLKVRQELSTAVYGEHYWVDTTQVYTIAVGDTSVLIPVKIIDDIEQNEDRYFELEIFENQQTVLSEVAQTMKVTILDDEEPVYVCFDKTSLNGIECDGALWLPVRINGNARVPIKVTLDIRGGNAVEGEDFIFEQRELTFPAGIKLDSVKIDLIDNDQYDLDRTLQIGFAAVEGAELSSSDTLATITIKNDDFDFNQLYDDLMGEWTMLIPNGANLPTSVTVFVSGGDTPAEEDANYLKYLVVRCDKFGQGSWPAKWRLSYDVETGALALVLGEVITEGVPFSVGKRDIKWDRGSADAIEPVQIFPSKDYQRLEFDPAVTVQGGGYDQNGKRDIWWLTLQNAVMVRENN